MKKLLLLLLLPLSLLAQPTVRSNMSQFTPSLVLNFTQGTLPVGLTFTRSSVATYFDASGVMQTAGVNQPRFDYDPVTHVTNGILIEESRTNSISGAEMTGGVIGGNFPTGWSFSVSNATITAQITNIYVDPRNRKCIVVAFSGTASGTSYPRFRFPLVSASNGQTWTASLTVKSVTSNYPITTYLEEQGGAYAGTGISIPLIQTEQKLSVTRTLSNSTTTGLSWIIGPNLTTGQTWNASIEICCPQLEQGAFPTSYIPTTSAAVTRGADVCSTPMSNWWNPNQGTFLAEWMGGRSSGQDYRGCIISTSNANAFLGMRLPAEMETWNGTSNLIASGLSTNYNITFGKAVFSYDNNLLARTLVASGTTVSGSYTGLYSGTVLYLGSRGGNNQWMNGYIRKITYYPRRLSNSYLQSLTQ
ncbi:hypothetical protein WBJ53_26165 [Spirosoma sp. SC4-14]|uniref:phage head spike fiber domain-containing protein n=1 Tax=Spirosoma sp. SC4-14 TaxID=3128900 RepID=UPI0030CC011D